MVYQLVESHGIEENRLLEWTGERTQRYFSIGSGDTSLEAENSQETTLDKSEFY